MKKFFNIKHMLLVFFICGLFFCASCKKDDTTDPIVPDDPTPEDPIVPSGPDYSYLFDDICGDVVENNLTFPDKVGELRLNFATSDSQTITDEGVVTQGRTDTQVIIYMGVIDKEGVGYRYEKEVTVKGIQFSDMRTERVIAGYLYSSSYKGYTETQKKGLDVVNVAFGSVTGDGLVSVSNMIRLLPGILSIRRSGVRVLLSLKNTAANFSDAAYTSAGRIKLAESILSTIETYHFDGIDIDWEFPGYNTNHALDTDKKNYTLLMKEIYETVKKANSDYLVTSATRGGSECRKNYFLGEASAYVDYYNVMTYDLYSSSRVYHHTAVFSNTGQATMTNGSLDGTVDLYHNVEKVPGSKFLAGIAFYGYEVATNQTSGTSVLGTLPTGSYESITYKNIKKYYLDQMATNSSIQYYYDKTCQAPYLFNSLTKKFVTYDDATSIKAKANYVFDNGLLGVMIWELTYDNEEEDMLLAVMRAMKRDLS